ncbi:ribonuclease P protein component [Paenimyroides aquimaris]|uniref:Ribonuclease P protein component n=2 Tax=Paenimyroides marinum TaxID=1159016 RepID=A0A1H6JCB2_9FLAO|nr:ribonuclease P protein component [Paenimyroides aquimaris]
MSELKNLYFCLTFYFMNQTYPKTEKLKKKKYIDLLFSEGRTVTKYPLRLVYVPVKDLEVPLQMGVSVSKRYFKKAVDRNYFKRVLRECYRLNKQILLNDLQEPYVMMFFYQTKERLTYTEIEEKTKQLFEKFTDTLQKTP